MENYRIGPWDQQFADTPELAANEQFVPPEIEAIAREVISLYDMHVAQMTLITSKPDKGGAIWRIDTDKGPRSIKVLHREPHRSLFSVGAQDYLVKQGARVPALVPARDGALHVEAGGKLWIVTDWIEPLQQVSKIDLEGASQLCYGLGEFHHLSKGYTPPFGAGKSSRLYKWPKYYEKMLKKIGWFRDLAEVYPETAASGILLSVVGEFERQAASALERFNQSAYHTLTGMGEPYWGLVHQDYGWSNGQLGPDGIWVIDLDGVAYDLPIRDLRKLITSTMDDMGTWDPAWIRGMIDAYHRANPLDRETFEILWIDMAFPNEFYKHVKEIVFDPVAFMNMELQPILERLQQTEASKWTALNEIELDKEKYAPGNYDAAAKPASPLISVPASLLGSAHVLPAVGAGQAADAAVPVWAAADHAGLPYGMAGEAFDPAAILPTGTEAAHPFDAGMAAPALEAVPHESPAGVGANRFMPKQPSTLGPLLILPGLRPSRRRKGRKKKRRRTSRSRAKVVPTKRLRRNRRRLRPSTGKHTLLKGARKRQRKLGGRRLSRGKTGVRLKRRRKLVRISGKPVARVFPPWPSAVLETAFARSSPITESRRRSRSVPRKEMTR